MTPSTQPIRENKSLRRLWIIAGAAVACVFLAVLSVFLYGYFGNDFKIPTAKMKIREIAEACKRYQIDHNGTYPINLKDLVVEDQDGKEPYLKSETLVDPWGETFRYDPDGAKSTRNNAIVVPDIYCKTPDGRMIGNWESNGK